MNEDEKKAFLKKMGMSGSILTHESLNTKKKEKKDNRIDRSELMYLARKFNVHPDAKNKPKTLTEFLEENKDG